MKNRILVEYSSNNSGGDWWLKDKDWKALAKAGWKVIWAWEEMIYTDDGNYIPDENGIPRTKKSGSRNDRWLGTLSHYAWKNFNSIQDAIREFEELTGQKTTDDGCNCCGAPHSFMWSASGCVGGGCNCKGPHKDYHYGSGSDLLDYLYGDGSSALTVRELLESH